MLITDQVELKTRLIAGTLTGLIAGLVMTIPMVLYYGWVTRQGVFYPANVIATWAGLPLIAADFGPQSIVGMMVHFLFSALLGLLWGALMTQTPQKPIAGAVGLIYGVMVYVVVIYGLSPLINPVFAAQMQGIPFLMAHLIFGACFAFYPRWVERFSTGETSRFAR